MIVLLFDKIQKHIPDRIDIRISQTFRYIMDFNFLLPYFPETMILVALFLLTLIRKASLPEKANLHRIEAIRRSHMSLHEKTNPISVNKIGLAWDHQ
ncbi:hypothetical protein JQC72_13385 [Polycladomyces sp. WAk]|uniref:Uncharacterized protein n=1 Tax=Polycladomyces zharkentensis TaxID=2807616 RepID=A0ABS2WLU4_9BACL|nr:hypothetical protein [Polycladomyces sp. WAk]MBN2910494.1 hypothetical protein [Polycladomyces sp. WAk]